MTERDSIYIAHRLQFPAGDAVQAIQRLNKIGKDAEARELTLCLRRFTAECRAIRRNLFPERS